VQIAKMRPADGLRNKAEHCGPKRGNGAYWGYKWEAKQESNRVRRETAKREIRSAVNEESAEPPPQAGNGG
jgi:hypothetical protein